jgi:hypothetical protein
MTGWIPVGEDPEDRWHREAFNGEDDGTYELVGPRINGNKEGFPRHILMPHGGVVILNVPTEFDRLREWLSIQTLEGVVWHHPGDGRMAKIKRRDFGFTWPVT